MTSSLVEAIARAVLAHRRRVLLALLAVTAVAAAMLPRLDADFSPTEMFAQLGDEQRVGATFRAELGVTDNVLVVLVEADDVLEPDPLRVIHDASAAMVDIDGVAAVMSVTTVPIPRRTAPAAPVNPGDSLAARTFADLAAGRLVVAPAVSAPIDEDDSARLRSELPNAPLVEGRLIAEDRSAAIVAVTVEGDRSAVEELTPVVEAVEAFVAGYPAPEGVRISGGGLPVVRVELVRKLNADQTVLLPAAFAICLLILLVTFRWWPAVVLPVFAVGVTAAVLVGGMAAVGEDLNIINNIVPLLVIIIGISDSIHLLARYGERLGEGEEQAVACGKALRGMLVACFLTSFTTAVGFGSLVVSNTAILRSFGLTAAIGVLLAYVVTMTLVPVLLTYVATPRRLARAAREGALERHAEQAMGWVLGRGRLVLLGAALLAGASVWSATRLEVDSALLDQFDEGGEVHRVVTALETKLNGVRPFEVLLETTDAAVFTDPGFIEALESIEAWAETQTGVISATSYIAFLREGLYVATGAPDARRRPFDSRDQVEELAGLIGSQPKAPLSQYLTGDRRYARVNIQFADVGSEAGYAFAEALRPRLASLAAVEAGTVTFAFTGQAFLDARGERALTRDLLTSLAVALVIIFGFITLVLRDLRLGLLSVPPNVLPLLVTMGYMDLRGLPLNVANVIIFSISIGMAVDASIHLLARFIEEVRAGATTEGALQRAARGTGKAVLVTCATLMIGFSSLQLSEFLPVRRFGELLAVTLGGCLVATLLILPPLIQAFWRPRRGPVRSE